jgi:hypothetical protein
MKTRAIFGSMVLAAVAWLGLSSPALAAPMTQTIDLNQVFTGNIPDGPSPWLSATFTFDPGSTTGTLVLTSKLSAADFVQGDSGVTGWGFYLSGNSLAHFSCSGVCADNVLTANLNSGPVKGSGKNGWGFNFGFGWNSGNRFDGTDSAIYQLTFANALSSTSPFAANDGGWYSYAHVQGLIGGCSGYIVSGNGTLGEQDGPCTDTPPPNNVPEPVGLGMFGLGAMLIGLFIGLRRRYA